MVKLKGISWDHKRGYNPLIYCSKDFNKINPEIEIEWDKRSLKDFGNFPVEKLAENYDLLIIDHPFSGEATKKNILVNLRDYINEDFLNDLSSNSIGKTFESYSFDNKLIALPVDAAAIVSAANHKWFENTNLTIPKNLKEVIELKKKLPIDKKILISLCSTDIWCVLLSLCATKTDGEFIDVKNGFKTEITTESIDLIKELISLSDNNPLELNPINILDLMGEDENYVYSPLLFGYVNYSINGEYKNLINFYDAPLEQNGKTSALLGGAGIAISSCSKLKSEAAKFIEYVSSEEVQKDNYFYYGGQPSHLKAWLSERLNKDSNDFFKNTFSTLDNAYVRPRFPGWNCYQDEASVLLHENIKNNVCSKNIVINLNNLFKKHFENKF